MQQLLYALERIEERDNDVNAPFAPEYLDKDGLCVIDPYAQKECYCFIRPGAPPGWCFVCWRG